MPNKGISDRQTRRKILKITGAAGGIGAFAGCSGDDGTETDSEDGGTEGSGSTDGSESTDNSNNTDSGGQPVDPVYSSYTRAGYQASEIHFNQYNAGNHSWIVNQFFFDRLALNVPDGDWIPGLASEWSVSDETMTINIREGATWHDGKDVTADDIANQLKLDLETGGQISAFVDEVSVADEKTLELNLPDPMNADLLKTVVLAQRIFAHPSQFGDYVDRIEDDSSDSEQALTDLQSMTWYEPVGNGPFAFEESSVDSIQATKFGDYPLAENVPIEEAEFLSQNSQQEAVRLREDEIDGVAGSFSPQVAETFPDHIRHDMIPRVGGYGFLLNHDHENFEDWRVRQALCWLHDPEQTQSGHADPEYRTTPDPVGHDFLEMCSDTVKDNIHRYNEGAFPDKAAELLEEAGFSQEDGEWYMPDGSRFEIVIDNTGEPTGQTPFMHQLRDFGIAAEINTKSESEWSGDFFNGDFQVFYHWWGASNGPAHPWFQMQWEWDPTSSDYADVMGKDVESFPVPMPIGDPDGDIEELNLLDTFQSLGRAQSEDEFQEHLDLLSWAWNQTLCTPQGWRSVTHHWADTQDWNWPSSEEVKQQLPRDPYYTAFRTGDISPVTE